MDPDTPLAEVAHFLGSTPAEALLYEPPATQALVLEVVRAYIVGLEGLDVIDPISLQENILLVVLGALGAVRLIERGA